MEIEAQNELVEKCLKALDDKNDPALETLRMQVEFDSEYYRQQGNIENYQARREENLENLTEQLCSIRAQPQAPSLPYKVTTRMYELLQQYVEAYVGKAAATGDAARKETTAALESVFPQTGLNAFLNLLRPDKESQLQELAQLVLGIRLFNWDIGKGGSGITNILGDALSQVAQTRGDVAQERDAAEEMAQQYSDVLRSLDLQHALQAWPDSSFQEASADGVPFDALRHLRDVMDTVRIPHNKRARWLRELFNRRQLASYLNTLHEELVSYENHIKTCVADFRRELTDTKNIVGGKASVPKEKVYPKFNSLARIWLAASDTAQIIYARKNVKECIQKFLSPGVCTLHLNTVRQVRSALAKVANDYDAPQLKNVENAVRVFEEFTLKMDENPEDDDETETFAEILSVKQHPDYLQLPLEFQGLCPMALIGLPYTEDTSPNNGALVAGNPHFGVGKFNEAYVVCSNEYALQRFVKSAKVNSDILKEKARQFPELIHLLTLQKHFAAASLPALIHSGGRMTQADVEAIRKGSELGATGPEVFEESSEKPPKIDVGTSTPVHFIEKNVQPNYTSNEWELRRRALKMAKLRQCATHGTQTNDSHFKRDNGTQVYLPREQGTQTGIERGTNPPKTVRYLTGLRWNHKVPVPAHPEASEKEKQEKAKENNDGMRTTAKFVNLTFDTTELK